MNDEPRVSVIVPVYNNARTIQASLSSLFQQTLTDIEIIAVNDSSSDDSCQILNRLAQNEPRLKVIHLSKNVGAHEARAAGVKESTAPFIGFLDADDFAKPEMYETMLQACIKHDAEIAICGISLCSQERKLIAEKLSFPKNSSEDKGIFEKFCRLGFGTGSLCNKLYRRELLSKYALTSFRWRQDSSEDTLVNIGCFLDARRVRLIDAQLHEYVVNPMSASRGIDKATCFVRMFRAYAIAIDLYGGDQNRVLDGITELYARQLQNPDYHPEDREGLRPYEAELAEAVNLIADKYPLGLAFLLSNRWLGNAGKSSLNLFGHIGNFIKSLRRLF